MSEANKEQALKCIQIARESLRNGDKDKCIRFVQKSIKLYDTPEAQTLLATVNSSSNGQSEPSTPTPDIGLRHRHVHADSQSQENTPPNREPQYTVEQLRDVKKMAKVTNFYKLLGLEKECTESEIKKAYRKMALKFHPDKNNAPGADEVFKSISAAYDCLSDADRRAAYDEYGTDSEHAGHGGYGGGQEGVYRTRGHPMTYEDIFEMFANASRQPYRRQQNPYRQQFFQRTRATDRTGNDAIFGQLLQIVPLLLLFLFSFISSTGTESTPFSLNMTSSYNVRRVTSSGGVEYYVAPTFYRRYGRDARALWHVEQMVEKEYLSDLTTKCQNEKKKKAELEKEVQKATGNKQEALLRQLFAMDLSSCEKLDNYGTS